MGWLYFSENHKILDLKKEKAPIPTLSVAKISASVRLQGLEPWTNRLRVYCSTN